MIPPGFLTPEGWLWHYNDDARQWEFGLKVASEIREFDFHPQWHLTDEALQDAVCPEIFLEELVKRAMTANFVGTTLAS